MKIGKFKKILVAGLVCALSFGLLTNTKIVNATGDNVENTVGNDIVSYTDVGPFMDPVYISSNQQTLMTKMARSIPQYTSTTSYADGGLVLDKKAKYIDSGVNAGKYQITLEAYTTGTVKTGEVVPTDIVLVLDDSGSMNFTFGNPLKLNDLDTTKPEGYYCYGERTGNRDTSTNEGDMRYNKGKWQYRKSNNGQWTEVPQQNTKNIYVVRTEMLQEICKNFINSVEESCTDTVTHRVAISTYASSGYDKEEMSTSFKNVSVSNEKNILFNTLDKLNHNGGTNSSIGLNRAYKYFDDDNLTGERNRVVIMFSDGEQDSNNARNSSLKASYKLKASTKTIVDTEGNWWDGYVDKYGMGATVYSIGIFTGANPSASIVDVDNQDSNKFMHYVSSNYPEAQSMDRGYEGGNNGYYLAAANSEELADIFEKIADEIQPSTSLGSETTVKDFISNYFVLDKNTDVKVYTQNYKGNQVFDDRVETDDVIITEDDDYVYVKGFDFTENAVVDKQGSIETSGKKIVIEFFVKRADGFIGGNAVPTNTDKSGLYEDQSKNNPLVVGDSSVIFAQPTVDVEIKYDASVNPAAMYAGDKWSDFSSFIQSIDDNNVSYTIDSELYNINGINNKFVNIKYQIFDGDEEIYQYTIKGDNNSHNASDKYDDDYLNMISEFKQDHDYTIKVTVEPNKTAVNDSYDNISINNLVENKSSKLYLYVPTINSIDQKIMLGDTVTFGNGNIMLKAWSALSKDGSSVTPTFDGTRNNEPGLLYTISGNGINENSFIPNNKGDYQFTYTVENKRTGSEITDISKFEESCSYNNGDISNTNRIIVHVVDGTITIDKILDTSGNNLQVDETDGTPIFTFKIDKLVDGNTTKSYYKTVELTKDVDGNWELSSPIVITGLEKGTYKVIELSTMRYVFSSVKVDNSPSDDEDGKTVSLNLDKTNATYEYTNTVKSTEYDSDNGYLVNKVVHNKDGSYSMIASENSEE